MDAGAPDGDVARPRRGLRRTATVLVALALAGSTGTATALTVPALTRPATPAPAPVVIVAPVPVLGPLAGPRPRPPPQVSARRWIRWPRRAGWASSPDRSPTPPPESCCGAAPPSIPLVPGSTVKLITSAATLLTLDSTKRLVTRVVAGPEPGTVVLVGGGDPTLTALPAEKAGVYPDPARLTALADAVRKARRCPCGACWSTPAAIGGRRCRRRWDPVDIEGGFVTPIEPLMLDGGRKDPAQPDGARVPTRR